MADVSKHELQEGVSRTGYELTRIVVPGSAVGLVAYYLYDTRVYDPVFVRFKSASDSAKSTEKTADSISVAGRHLLEEDLIDNSVFAMMEQEKLTLKLEAQAIRNEMPNLAIERTKLLGTGLVPAMAVMGLALASRRFWSRYRR